MPDSTPPAPEPKVFDDKHRGKEAMRVLSKFLADNHFDVTFGYPKKPATYFRAYEKIFGETRDRVEAPRARNIVIVGAGVSYAAFGGELFPLAYNAVDELRRRLGVRGLRDALGHSDGVLGDIPDRIAEEEEIFRQLYQVKDPRHDFESQLAILSKFYTPRQIRGVLGKIYHPRYYPHMVFETIAHLLKHRFIDAVINYNFDEVLDQAIEEEVRGGDYQYVISDGNCVDLSHLVVDDALKVPLYIKPHGTITHKSTLRFTKDAYVGMPSDLLAFTRKILLGQSREDPRLQKDSYRVNLISIGFAFTSVELTEMLRGHEGLKVFHINLEGEKNEAQLYENVAAIGKGVEQFLIGVKPPDTDSAKGAGSADPADPPVADGDLENWPTIADAVDALFHRTIERFEHPYEPRHLVRHRVVHSLLFKEGGPVPPRRVRKDASPPPHGSGTRVPLSDRHYHYARLCVELAIALAKGNGRIDLSTLVDDRVGIYFREWRRREPEGAGSLRSICVDRFKLEDRYGFAGNVFTTEELKEDRNPGPDDKEREKEYGEIDRDDRLVEGTAKFAGQLWCLLRDALLQIDDGVFRDHIRGWDTRPRRKEIIRLLTRLHASDVQELAPRFSLDALLLLNRAESKSVIHTALGMTARYMGMVDDPRWDLMLAVSEQGKVLNKLTEGHWRKEVHTETGPRVVRRRASLVVADPVDPEVMNERLDGHRREGNLIGADYRLPYWTHNDHMIVVLRMGVNRGDFEPLAAISYRRPGLRNRVNPVFIEDPDDLELLVQMYFGYVAKAEPYMRLGGRDATAGTVFAGEDRGGVPDVNRHHAVAVRTRVLGEWWDEMMQDRRPAAGHDEPGLHAAD